MFGSSCLDSVQNAGEIFSWTQMPGYNIDILNKVFPCELCICDFTSIYNFIPVLRKFIRSLTKSSHRKITDSIIVRNDGAWSQHHNSRKTWKLRRQKNCTNQWNQQKKFSKWYKEAVCISQPKQDRSLHAVGRKNTLRTDNESLYCRVLFGVHVSLLRKIHNIMVVRVSHNLS